MYERKNETFLLGFVCVDTLVQRRYSSPSGFRKKDRVERRRKREGKREREGDGTEGRRLVSRKVSPLIHVVSW